jgi:hypothetical protein
MKSNPLCNAADVAVVTGVVLLQCSDGNTNELLLTAQDGNAAELVIQAAEGDAKLPTLNMVAYNGGPIYPGGWYERDPIIIDLAGLECAQSVPIDSNHIRDIGHTTSIDKSVKSLKAVGTLSAYSPDATDESAVESRRVARMGANQFPFKASITPVVARDKIEFCAEGMKIQANGRSWPGPVYVARKGTLMKIAVLSNPADSTTTTKIAAQRGSTNMDPEFVAWLKAEGLPETVEGKLLTKLQAQFNAEKNPTPPVVKPPENTPPVNPPAITDPKSISVAAAAAEQRLSDIRLICKSNPDLMTEVEIDGKKVKQPIVVVAMRDDWTAEKTRLVFELEAERASRPQAAMVGGVHGHDTDCTLEAMQGAMILRAGVQLDHPSFITPGAVAMKLPRWLRMNVNADQRQKAMEAAHRYSDMSLCDMASEIMRLSGKRAPRGREEMIQAAFSGGSLTHIFTTNINTMILVGYTQTGDTTDGWTRTTDVNDFKINERPRMKTGPGLTKHPRGGRAEHGTREDTGESYKIARYTKQWNIAEEDMIDDAFDSLGDMPLQFGNAALRLRPDLVYSVLLANPEMADEVALFDAAHGNLGTGAALAADKLKAAITAMRLQQENDVNLGIKATHAIVPATLEWVILELLQSTTLVIAGTAGSVTERGSNNTLASRLIPIAEERIENGLLDPDSGESLAGSASTWFLASNTVNTIEVAYRRGTNRVPTTRSWVLDKGEYGIGFDICLDIGCKAMDYRGLRKMTA